MSSTSVDQSRTSRIILLLQQLWLGVYRCFLLWNYMFKSRYNFVTIALLSVNTIKFWVSGNETVTIDFVAETMQ